MNVYAYAISLYLGFEPNLDIYLLRTNRKYVGASLTECSNYIYNILQIYISGHYILDIAKTLLITLPLVIKNARNACFHLCSA